MFCFPKPSRLQTLPDLIPCKKYWNVPVKTNRNSSIKVTSEYLKCENKLRESNTHKPFLKKKIQWWLKPKGDKQRNHGKRPMSKDKGAISTNSEKKEVWLKNFISSQAIFQGNRKTFSRLQIFKEYSYYKVFSAEGDGCREATWWWNPYKPEKNWSTELKDREDMIKDWYRPLNLLKYRTKINQLWKLWLQDRI